jgi:NAD+ kinase
VKKIGLVVKADPQARRKADEMAAWLDRRGVGVMRRDNRLDSGAPPGSPDDLDCLFVLGGDGTFLSAVRWLGAKTVPVLGVKFGSVGFLAETTEEELYSAAEAVLERRFKIHPRMRLEVSVHRDGREVMSETVLNDVVINKGALARLADIETYIDDHYLTTYRADGLIVATPTGSTAYSLAAGGPIIVPEVPGIVLTPICPFTLTVRPLIIPDTVCVKVKLAEKTPDIRLTFDGQVGMEIGDRDNILIRQSPYPVNMIALPGLRYYDLLKAKLRWSGGRV